jgi:hypothetical protein
MTNPTALFKIRAYNATTVPRTSMIYTMLAGGSWALGLLLLILGAFLPGNENDLLHNALFYSGCAIFPFAFIGTWIANRHERRYVKELVAKLAEDNKLTTITRRKPVYDKSFMPAIAEVGMLARDFAVASGTIGKRPVNIIGHTYVTWTVTYERTHILCVKVDFNYQLPHIVLQTRNSEGSRFVNALGRTFDDNQRVSLQNDLDKYFLFYTHRRTVTDALVVLSPQLLEQLRKLDCAISLETIGKSAYFYIGLPDAYEIDLQTSMNFITKAVASIERNTKIDFLKLPNDSKYPFLRSRPTGGVVEFSGKYFNYAAVALVAQFGWNVFRVFVNKESDLYPHRWWLTLGAGVLTAGFIWYLLVARDKYTKTQDRRGY